MDLTRIDDDPGAHGAGGWNAAVRRHSIDCLQLHPGQRVLDVGCGPDGDGLATLVLAKRVGMAGQVRGVDYDVAIVAQANQRARAAGVADRVIHQHANATALPWPEGFFDASRCLGLLQSLIEPERAIDEILRVTRSGGHVVVGDVDWSTLSIACDEPDIERRLVRHHIEAIGPNPFSGRRLPAQLAARRLQGMQVQVWPLWSNDPLAADDIIALRALEDEALAAGVVDADELRRWRDSLARSAAGQGYCASVNAIVVNGCRY